MFAGCATAVVLSLVLGVVALRTTFGRIRITGESMSPALVKGDALLTRPAKEIRRGDIVAYVPLVYRQRFVHRVIGLPGESVAMREGVVFINGLPLEEPYAWMDEQMSPEMTVRDFAPIRLAADTFFILGDNRDNANDSRFLGPIPRENIRGRVVFVLSKENGMWRP